MFALFSKLSADGKDGFYTDFGPYSLPEFQGTDPTETGYNLANCGREVCEPAIHGNSTWETTGCPESGCPPWAFA